MPFADFLATAGSGSVVGNVAEAFGGRTPERRGVDAFNAQLETIYQAFDRATTEKEIEDAGRLFSQAWARAGGPSDERFDKFAERLTRTALNRVQRGELDKIRRDYGAVPAQPRPEGTEGPLTQEGNFIDPRAGRPPDADWAHRMFQATGAKPEHLENIFQTPAKIAVEEAKGTVERERALAAQRKARTIENLPDTPQPGGMISPRSMAAIHEPGLTQYEPQRERPTDPLEQKRGEVMDAQILNLKRLANTPPGGAPPRGSTEMQDYLAQGGNPNDQDAFLDYIERRRGRTSVTETETPPKGFELEATLAGIAKDAYAQGKKTPQQIKDFAASRNVELEGEPKIEGGGMFGGNPTLSGVTGVRAKPKVVTKGPAGKAPGAANVMRSKSKSGQPIVSTDGGKTWRYE